MSTIFDPVQGSEELPMLYRNQLFQREHLTLLRGIILQRGWAMLSSKVPFNKALTQKVLIIANHQENEDSEQKSDITGKLFKIALAELKLQNQQISTAFVLRQQSGGNNSALSTYRPPATAPSGSPKQHHQRNSQKQININLGGGVHPHMPHSSLDLTAEALPPVQHPDPVLGTIKQTISPIKGANYD